MRKYIFLFLILISCKNDYSKYGQKILIEDLKFKKCDTCKFKQFRLIIDRDEYNIASRIIWLNLDSSLLYKGTFKRDTSINIDLPENYISREIETPSITIAEINSKEGCYIESKNTFFIKPNDNTLVIELTKADNYDDRIQAISKHL